MKLIEIKCPNCRATINIMDHETRVKCEFCGTNFLVDDGVITVRHLQKGQITDEQEFVNADTNLNKFKNYAAAYREYLTLSKRYLNDKRVWIGLLRSYTQDFTFKFDSEEFNANCEMYWNHFVSLANKSEIAEYEQKYKNYLKKKPIKIMPGDPKNEKNYTALTIFGGMFGIHKFVQKDKVMGLLYLFTAGLFGVGYVKDVYYECSKWKNSSQLKISRIVLAIIFIILGISSAKYSIGVFFLYLITALLTLNFIWKALGKEDAVLFRILLVLFLFIISVSNSPSDVPLNLQAKWILIDSKNEIIKIEFNGKNANFFMKSKEGEEEIINKYTAEHYKNIIYIYDEDSNLQYKLEYKDDIKKICLLDKDKCTSYYKIIKK